MFQLITWLTLVISSAARLVDHPSWDSFNKHIIFNLQCAPLLLLENQILYHVVWVWYNEEICLICGWSDRKHFFWTTRYNCFHVPDDHCFIPLPFSPELEGLEDFSTRNSEVRGVYQNSRIRGVLSVINEGGEGGEDGRIQGVGTLDEFKDLMFPALYVELKCRTKGLACSW